MLLNEFNINIVLKKYSSMLSLLSFNVFSSFILYLLEYLQREEPIQELIQDLRFETATSKIKATPDGEFLIASGASQLNS